MKKTLAILLVTGFFLTGCSSSTENKTTTPDTTAADTTVAEATEVTIPETTIAETTQESEAEAASGTVEIEDLYGTVTVPVNPQRVVALDSRTYETLDAWGIEIVAGPKGLMPDGISYKTNDDVEDIGTHNEPNLEVIAAVEPDLVIIGQRFAGHREAILDLGLDAVIIDLNIDVSEEAANPGDNLVNGFIDFTMALGQIFDKNAEAEALIADFEDAMTEAQAAYNGTDTIMTIIVSGGNIRFAAPQSGRVWGPLYDVFGWVSSLEIDDASSDHQGDEIGIEAIAESDPDWIFVLDRDAMNASADGYVPAYDIIAASPALANITAVTGDQMVFAPNDTYTNESIQTFTTLFKTLASALSE